MLVVGVMLSLSTPVHAEKIGCTDALLRQGLEKIEAAPEPFKLATTIIILREACKYSPGVETVMKEWTRASESKLPAWDHKAALDDPGSWVGACHGGPSALPDRDILFTQGARRKIYQDCNLGRFKFANEDRFAAGTGAVVLPILTVHLMHSYAVPIGLAHKYVRALAGIPEREKNKSKQR